MPVGGNEMTKVNDILEKLRYFENENEITKETLTTVYDNQEEFTPYFIRALERVTAEPDLIYRGEKDYALHYYSLLFLAAFREKAAFPMILKLARLNEEDLEDLFSEDYLKEDFPRVLKSTFDNDFDSLKETIKNKQLSDQMRTILLELYLSTSKAGREQDVTFLRDIIENSGLENLTSVAETVIFFELHEMKEDIQSLFDQERIDVMQIENYQNFMDRLFGNGETRLPLEWTDSAKSKMLLEERIAENREVNRILEQYLGQATKKREWLQKARKGNFERNEPCPCGSGKKYKKCHLKIDQQAEKEKIPVEPMRIQQMRLNAYPFIPINSSEKTVKMMSTFDKKALEINGLVYLALHDRSETLVEYVDSEELFDLLELEDQQMLKKIVRFIVHYLLDAHRLFLEKVTEEGFSSFEAYDEKYKLHYRSQDWHQLFIKYMRFLPEEFDEKTCQKVEILVAELTL